VSGQAQAVTTSYLKDNSGKDISWLEPGQSGGFNFLLRDDTGKVEAVKVFTSCACEQGKYGAGRSYRRFLSGSSAGMLMVICGGPC
jgi:hypothetical protein